MKPVRLSKRARADIDHINQQIAEDRPMAAVSFVDRLLERCQRIASAPEAYALRPEYGPGVRAVVFDPYHVFYRIRPDRIVIVTVRHGARRPVKL